MEVSDDDSCSACGSSVLQLCHDSDSDPPHDTTTSSKLSEDDHIPDDFFDAFYDNNFINGIVSALNHPTFAQEHPISPTHKEDLYSRGSLFEHLNTKEEGSYLKYHSTYIKHLTTHAEPPDCESYPTPLQKPPEVQFRFTSSEFFQNVCPFCQPSPIPLAVARDLHVCERKIQCDLTTEDVVENGRNLSAGDEEAFDMDLAELRTLDEMIIEQMSAVRGEEDGADCLNKPEDVNTESTDCVVESPTKFERCKERLAKIMKKETCDKAVRDLMEQIREEIRKLREDNELLETESEMLREEEKLDCLKESDENGNLYVEDRCFEAKEEERLLISESTTGCMIREEQQQNKFKKFEESVSDLIRSSEEIHTIQDEVKKKEESTGESSPLGLVASYTERVMCESEEEEMINLPVEDRRDGSEEKEEGELSSSDSDDCRLVIALTAEREVTRKKLEEKAVKAGKMLELEEDSSIYSDSSDEEMEEKNVAEQREDIVRDLSAAVMKEIRKIQEENEANQNGEVSIIRKIQEANNNEETLTLKIEPETRTNQEATISDSEEAGTKSDDNIEDEPSSAKRPFGLVDYDSTSGEEDAKRQNTFALRFSPTTKTKKKYRRNRSKRGLPTPTKPTACCTSSGSQRRAPRLRLELN